MIYKITVDGFTKRTNYNEYVSRGKYGKISANGYFEIGSNNIDNHLNDLFNYKLWTFKYTSYTV